MGMPYPSHPSGPLPVRSPKRAPPRPSGSQAHPDPDLGDEREDLVEVVAVELSEVAVSDADGGRLTAPLAVQEHLPGRERAAQWAEGLGRAGGGPLPAGARSALLVEPEGRHPPLTSSPKK